MWDIIWWTTVDLENCYVEASLFMKIVIKVVNNESVIKGVPLFIPLSETTIAAIVVTILLQACIPSAKKSRY